MVSKAYKAQNKCNTKNTKTAVFVRIFLVANQICKSLEPNSNSSWMKSRRSFLQEKHGGTGMRNAEL
jgi:hypothetical protein